MVLNEVPTFRLLVRKLAVYCGETLKLLVARLVLTPVFRNINL